MNRLSALMLALVGCAATSAQASTVLVHNGATDPITEGWSNYIGSGGATTAGPVFNDLGSGFDAWTIDDNSTAFDTGRWYYEDLTTAQVSEGTTAGWHLSVRLRVVNTPDGFASVAGFGLASAVSAFYRDGARDWYLGFGSETDGDLLIRLPDSSAGNPWYTFTGGGSGYHLYELVYDPVALSADFFIDGIERRSNIVGNATSGGQRRVAWGAATSPDAGQGNYNYVNFTAAAPVPPAVLLLGSALATLAGLRRVSARGNRRS